MRPDEDRRLTSMRKGESTCDLCIRLYPKSEVCENCALNPMVDSDEAAKTFVKESWEFKMDIIDEMTQAFIVLKAHVSELHQCAGRLMDSNRRLREENEELKRIITERMGE